MLTLFQLLIFLIAPSFVIIDFKIKNEGLAFIHLLIPQMPAVRRGEMMGKRIVSSSSAASKLRGSFITKCLKREDTNVDILLTEMTCPAYKHQRTKNCFKIPRNFRATIGSHHRS